MSAMRGLKNDLVPVATALANRIDRGYAGGQSSDPRAGVDVLKFDQDPFPPFWSRSQRLFYHTAASPTPV